MRLLKGGELFHQMLDLIQRTFRHRLLLAEEKLSYHTIALPKIFLGDSDRFTRKIEENSTDRIRRWRTDPLNPRNFPELFQEAESHEDYWLAGAVLDFTEGVVREMERQGMTRTELAERLGTTPAYVTRILRGKVNFTLATMVRLARALGCRRPARETKIAVTAARPAAKVARTTS